MQSHLLKQAPDAACARKAHTCPSHTCTSASDTSWFCALQCSSPTLFPQGRFEYTLINLTSIASARNATKTTARRRVCGGLYAKGAALHTAGEVPNVLGQWYGLIDQLPEGDAAQIIRHDLLNPFHAGEGHAEIGAGTAVWRAFQTRNGMQRPFHRPEHLQQNNLRWIPKQAIAAGSRGCPRPPSAR